jgi:SHS2 domain-containing protein
MYELFDHTADVGLRIRADGLDGLFADAARALFSAIVVNPDAVRPVHERTFRVDGDDRENLLHDWLAELLYVFHVEHRLFSEFDVHLADDGLLAVARGEPFDETRHELDAEIKAITYHGLKVERDGDGWLAEVIVDI